MKTLPEQYNPFTEADKQNSSLAAWKILYAKRVAEPEILHKVFSTAARWLRRLCLETHEASLPVEVFSSPLLTAPEGVIVLSVHEDSRLGRRRRDAGELILAASEWSERLSARMNLPVDKIELVWRSWVSELDKVQGPEQEALMLALPGFEVRANHRKPGEYFLHYVPL